MDTLLHSTGLALSGLNPLDWIFAVTLAVSTVTAFLRGLILSIVSLAGLVAGVFAAAFYASRVSPYLLRWFGSLPFARVAAFVLILVSVCLLAALLGRLLRRMCSLVGLGILDRLAGAAFGFLRGVLLLAGLVVPLTPYLQTFTVARSSVLLPYLLPAAHGISFVMPHHLALPMPTVDSLFSGDPTREQDNRR
ncbi:MAG: CvpA family protein [Janthinobacterium lividum]